MIVMQLPPEVYDAKLLVFVVGILIGVLVYAYSDKVREHKKGVLGKMVAIVMAVLSLAGLMGTLAFNIYEQRFEEENTQEYIEKTQGDLSSRLTETTTVKEFGKLIGDLYTAEYHVLENSYDTDLDKRTVGDLMINGTGTDVAKYLDSLDEAGRGLVLETNKNSLDTFTVLEFAKLETDIKSESLKLGSTGSMEVLEIIGNQQEALLNKVEKLTVEETSIGQLLTVTLAINVAMILVSVLITVLLYQMMITLVEDTKNNKKRYIESHKTEKVSDSTPIHDTELDEFTLVDGELKDVDVNENSEQSKEVEETDITNVEDSTDPILGDTDGTAESMAETLVNKEPEEVEKELDELIDKTVKDRNKTNVFKDKE